MKNAGAFILTLHADYPLARYIADGINTTKSIDPNQEKLIIDVLGAAKAKTEAENLKGYQQTLLAMEIITFVNTL